MRKAPGAAVIGGSLNRFGTLSSGSRARGATRCSRRSSTRSRTPRPPGPPSRSSRTASSGSSCPRSSLSPRSPWPGTCGAGAPAERAFLAGVSVLVIACPCSLGLATPLAVLVHASLASARGVLTKGGEVIEQAARVRRAVFDKTGTLTAGALVAARGRPGAGARTRPRRCAWPPPLESRSEHVIGAALVEAARGRTLPRRLRVRGPARARGARRRGRAPGARRQPRVPRGRGRRRRRRGGLGAGGGRQPA